MDKQYSQLRLLIMLYSTALIFAILIGSVRGYINLPKAQVLF